MGWDKEGRGAMGKVETGGCKAFGGGEAKPVPEGIEDADRDAPVDDLAALLIRAGSGPETVFEAAAKEDQSKFRVFLKELGDEVFQVSSHTGGADEGRPVIDEDAHERLRRGD